MKILDTLIPLVCIIAILALVAQLFIPPKDRHFWYPVELKEASCPAFKGEVYLMTNSVGWRNWPYYLDKADKAEVTLGSNCVLKTIRTLPKYEGHIDVQLNDEQKQYLIEGFR